MRFVSFTVTGVALAFLLVGCGAEESTAPEEVTNDELATEVEELEELVTIELAEGDTSEDGPAIPEDSKIDTEALLAAIRARDEAALKDIQPIAAPPTITIMRALDKVTARVVPLEVPEGQEVRFGTLAITARLCRSRPPEETPETYAFLEIDDIKNTDERERVFTGWMLASSPALNSLEHPVYDVWVIDCRIADGGESASSE